MSTEDFVARGLRSLGLDVQPVAQCRITLPVGMALDNS